MEKYKAAAIDEAEEAYYINHAARVASAWLIPIFIVAAIVFGIVAAQYKAVTIWDCISILSVISAVGSIVLFNVLRLIKTKTPGRWGTARMVRNGWPGYHWVEESLRSHDDEMEPFAIDIALRVHEYLPDADLHLDVLRQKPKPQELPTSQYISQGDWDGDPFLVLHVAGEDHYLAVWGEKGFEREQHP